MVRRSELILMITSHKGVGYKWIWVDMVGMEWIQEKVNFDLEVQKFNMETFNGSQ